MENANSYPNTRKIIAASVTHQKAQVVLSAAVTQTNKTTLELALAFRKWQCREELEGVQTE